MPQPGRPSRQRRPAGRPRPPGRRPARRPAPPPPAARRPHHAAALGLRGHRDGAHRVHGPPGAAAGRRPRRLRRAWRPPRAPSRWCCPPQRGDILDRNGEPLAESIDGLMVVADPAVTVEPRPPRSPSSSPAGSASTTSRPWPSCATAPAGSSTSPAGCPPPRPPTCSPTADELGYDGLSTRSRPAARLPRPTTSRPTWSASSAPTRPTAGSRRSSTRSCRGKDGEATLRGGRGGNRIPLGDNTTTDAVDGQDLHTTIDRDLQWYTQRVLRQGVEALGGESGLAVVMDCRTGEVLALADDPTFDANKPAESPKEDRGSRALSLAYEPGSVEKVLTVSSLVDAGLVTARTKLAVPGSLSRQDRVDPRLLGARPDPPHHGRRASPSPPTSAPCWPPTGSSRASCARTCASSGSASAPTSASTPRPAASCPRARRGPARPRTASPSASRSRSTACRWPPRSTPSPTAACGSTPASSRAAPPRTTARWSAPTSPRPAAWSARTPRGRPRR